MSKVSVLVVDDALFIRDLIKKGLRSYFPGIHVDEAVNGRKAQQVLATRTFDLILCDWEMPEMSGLELLTWFRQQAEFKSIPFIMVTSRGDKDNVVQAIQAGVTDYIGKPFTQEQLTSKVTKALTRSGRLSALTASAPAKTLSTGVANDSLSALTGHKAPVAPATAPPAAKKPAASPAQAVAAAPAATSAALRGQGQGRLRLSNGEFACVIKALSLKDALLVIKRGDVLPQVLDNAVLDLEQGEEAEVARLNAYVHAISALESRPDSEWLQVTCRFVDSDPKKMDYLSRLIARGSTQRHFSPSA
ncbi:response regulator [Pseudomonas sp. C27(2019)]|uniref:response regulator n=1 Tax=Pseudomonas sp. C27(2019) TaxID=2604941 RepID=UPI0012476FCD|nr:response regulator [Pseudomonas sp. C27(2019)]QEY59995.1 response regulator [Pseudomonas sp. C27(2019)]